MDGKLPGIQQFFEEPIFYGQILRNLIKRVFRSNIWYGTLLTAQ